MKNKVLANKHKHHDENKPQLLTADKMVEMDVFISNAKQEASHIIAEAEKRTEAMTAEANQTAANIVAEAEKLKEALKAEHANMLTEAEKQTKAMTDELANWEEEKKRIASTHNLEATIKLDIGGHSFTTTLTTLTRFPDTMLGAMFSGRHALAKNEAGAHFIDRDGTHFRYILNFLRSPETFDSSIQGCYLTELKNEADYYGLKDLMFPPPPPFVPAKAVTVVSYVFNGRDGSFATITQDNDQLWYIQHKDLGVTPVVVYVCETCGFGWPGQNPIDGHSYYGITNFKMDHTIIAAQPRMAGPCQCPDHITTL